ncbi:hypothetical protein PR048_031085 [Dryococelus australis]|uniref:Uncharacterized protein n=1 Tax=Dryococelus australis TaxID=614101 RepID=A0ABQ9G8E1_9NEOP|nr:hypothetical protein PR048_031085 [Dryococelus australis]
MVSSRDLTFLNGTSRPPTSGEPLRLSERLTQGQPLETELLTSAEVAKWQWNMAAWFARNLAITGCSRCHKRLLAVVVDWQQVHKRRCCGSRLQQVHKGCWLVVIAAGVTNSYTPRHFGTLLTSEVIPGRWLWESCRMMLLVGGFSRGSPVSPATSFRRHSIFTPITLIGSQDLAVKRRRNLFTHSQISRATCFSRRDSKTSCTAIHVSSEAISLLDYYNSRASEVSANQSRTLNSTVLFILEPPSFPHWLLTKRDATPLPSQLHVIRGHNRQVFIYWRRISESRQVWPNGKPTARSRFSRGTPVSLTRYIPSPLLPCRRIPENKAEMKELLTPRPNSIPHTPATPFHRFDSKSVKNCEYNITGVSGSQLGAFRNLSPGLGTEATVYGLPSTLAVEGTWCRVRVLPAQERISVHIFPPSELRGSH